MSIMLKALQKLSEESISFMSEELLLPVLDKSKLTEEQTARYLVIRKHTDEALNHPLLNQLGVVIEVSLILDRGVFGLKRQRYQDLCSAYGVTFSNNSYSRYISTLVNSGLVTCLNPERKRKDIFLFRVTDSVLKTLYTVDKQMPLLKISENYMKLAATPEATKNQVVRMDDTLDGRMDEE